MYNLYVVQIAQPVRKRQSESTVCVSTHGRFAVPLFITLTLLEIYFSTVVVRGVYPYLLPSATSAPKTIMGEKCR